MKNLLVVLVLLVVWLAGCTTAKFTYEFEQTDPNLTPARINADYCTVGGKEYQGLEVQATDDWGLKVNKSSQQEIDVDTIAAKLFELMATKSPGINK